MRECAQILLEGSWESYSYLAEAKSFGDDFIPVLRRASDDFRHLSYHNGRLVADFLADIDSHASLAACQELYSRDDTVPRLVGALALSKRGELDDISFLTSIIENGVREYTAWHVGSGKIGFDGWQVAESVQFASIALGRTRDRRGLPALLKLLEARAPHYWMNAHACDALAEIGDTRAITVLRDCLRDPEFHALSEAFRASVILGDNDAIGLAVERVSPEIEESNSGLLVRELEQVTGQTFGYDGGAWRTWWKTRREKGGITGDQKRARS
jgi:hypothetical protein